MRVAGGGQLVGFARPSVACALNNEESPVGCALSNEWFGLCTELM